MSRFEFINFVKQIGTKCDKNETNLSDLNGDEIKEFYENVILTNDPLNDKIKSELRQKTPKNDIKKTEIKSNVNQNQKAIKLESIFKFCQNGDLEECLQWIRMGFDINSRDQYLWTPIMCSSCAGHQSVVKLLLQNGADISATDKTGRTAFDLALINGHQNICQLITEYKNSKNYIKTKKRTKSKERAEEKLEKEDKKCDVCGYQYNGCDVRHNCSIVHRIHLKNDRKKFNKFYEISESNKGFQMMLRSGWTRDRGLGPEGSGMTAPIKTVLKRDRLGLGNVHNRPKVTHFSSYDETSVKNIKENKPSKTLRRKRHENRLKRLEIKFRNEFK